MKLLAAGVLVVLVVLLNVVTFPRNTDAAHVAARKAGITQITKVERSWFNLCKDEFAGYNVTGVRNGHRTTVLVCAYPHPFTSLSSYIR